MNLRAHPEFDNVQPPEELGGWLGQVVDGHYGGYLAWEPASGVLWCSDTLLATLGRSREHFPPHYASFRDLLPPEDSRRVEAELRSHVVAGRDYRIEFRMRHRSGDLRDIDCRTSANTDARGRLWYVGMIRDVTEERATQRALEQSEARFRELAENIPGATFRYVRGADGSDGVEYVSQGCEAIWEISAEEIEREPTAVWRRILPEDAVALRAAIEHSARDLTPLENVFRLRTESGQIKWLHGRGTPTRLENGSTLWNSIVLDVSDRHSAEAELRDSQQRLARASRLEAVGKLTGGVAHDFNNMLAVILGNAELLEDTADPAAVAEGLRNIRTAAERGSALTRSLLSFSRQAPLAPERHDLGAILSDTLHLCRRAVPASIRIETELPATPCHVVVDRNSLENALLNLVINARDAMPEGGALTLRVCTVSGSDADRAEQPLPAGRYHEIAVLDSGHGIVPDVLEHVFEPFFSTKGMSEGSGLGLSMVHGFASQSGGTVRIESTPGRGTEVAMLFPAAEAAPDVVRREQRRTVPNLPPLRTLLVEDDAAVRTLFAEMLGQTGLDVTTAGTGDEAVAVLDADADIALLVTDMVLPGTTQGSDVVHHARRTHPGIPILVVTGYAEDASVFREHREADAVLTKPTRRSTLVETLDRIIRTRYEPRLSGAQ